MTTGRPLEVYTAREGQKYITHCSLDIDLRKNEPTVLAHEKVGRVLVRCFSQLFIKLANDGSTARFPAQWRGTEISVTIEGNWSAGVGQSYKVRSTSKDV
jgi:DNA topoisomerase VI subunit B